MMNGQMEDDQTSMVLSSLNQTMEPCGSRAAQDPSGIIEFTFNDHLGFIKAFFAPAFFQVVQVGDIRAGHMVEGGQVPVAAIFIMDQTRHLFPSPCGHQCRLAAVRIRL